jgi:hypothetical protein
MGGDDLGDDFDYLRPSKDDAPSSPVDAPTAAAKRTPEKAAKEEEEQPARKKRKAPTEESVLVEAGCGMEARSAQEQASFLTASLQHYAMLAANSNNDNNDHDHAPTTTSPAPSVDAKHMATASSNNNNTSLADRLKQVVSLKRMKHHKEVGSPSVVILCQSARRAVAVLQELHTLKVRAAKLFPKSGDIRQQLHSLHTTAFPLAVGTPHRLRALSAHGDLFRRTQVVVLDGFVSKAHYTVCTLPDTAADTMGLLSEFVLPALHTNKNLKLAFL